MWEWSWKNLQMKSLAFKVLPSALFFMVFLFLVHLEKQNSPNRDDLKLKELQQLATEIPVFPAFSEVTTHESSRSIDAGVYKYYFGVAHYDDVKQFYSSKLGERGWRLSREENLKDWFRDYGGKQLTFEKGNYLIVIEYDGDNPNRGRSNYGVSFIWRNK
jgi:hypothetical protein